MVVLEEREAVRSAILQYMRGEIDNFAFDYATFSRPFKDQSVEAISAELWFTYDDLRRHTISVTEQGWKAYRRCAAFLETSIEISRPHWRDKMDLRIWPFPDRRSIFANRSRISRPTLPSYDPVLHNPPRYIFGLRDFNITWWNLPIVLAVLFGIPMLFAWWSCHR